MSKKYCIIAGKDVASREILQRSITKVTKNQDGIIFARNIEAGYDEYKNFMFAESDIDIVATDVFLNQKFNLFSFIRELEEVPKYWNTPLLVYTSGLDLNMFNRIRKLISNIPFRVMTQPLKETTLTEAISGLIEFKRHNSHTQELQSKIMSLIKVGDPSLIPGSLKMIDEYAKKHPKAMSAAKVNHLKGQLYYDFNLQKKLEAEKMLEDGRKDDADALLRECEEFESSSEQLFLAGHRTSPRYWHILNSLYSLYMDRGDIKEAKKYLSKLIAIFPEESKYAFKMGKIDEIEGNYSSAVRGYLSAWKSYAEDGIGQHDVEEVMEIIDASLESSQIMLREMELSKFTTANQDIGSREYTLIRTMKQHNAMTRTALVQIAKEVPDDSNIFNKIGITYRRTGDYDMALKMYVRALKLEPENFRIRINYAVALAMLGAWDKAKKELAKAERSDTGKEEKAVFTSLDKVMTKKKAEQLAKMLV